MAVQARYLATHAFRQDPRAIRPALGDATGDTTPGSGDHLLLLLAQLQSRGDDTAFSDPPSELTCTINNDDNIGCFVPRKRARAGDVSAACGPVMENGNGGALPPQAFVAGTVRGRDHGSGAASTSAAPPPPVVVSQGLLSRLHRHGVEIDALVRVECERLRAGLEEARRRHARAVASALEREAARRMRAAESELERALVRGAELEGELRRVVAEGQAWRCVANGHEAAAAGLRAALDQQLLLQQQQPCAGAEAEDARSCCFERDDRGAGDREDDGARACKSCGDADACVLLLPCRHLCLCARCEAAVDACPVCAAAKNASLHVLLS